MLVYWFVNVGSLLCSYGGLEYEFSSIFLKKMRIDWKFSWGLTVLILLGMVDFLVVLVEVGFGLGRVWVGFSACSGMVGWVLLLFGWRNGFSASLRRKQIRN